MHDEDLNPVNLEIKLGSDGEAVSGNLEKTSDGFIFKGEIPDLGPRFGNSLAIEWWDPNFCRVLDTGGAASPEMNAFGYSTKLAVSLDAHRYVEVELLRREDDLPSEVAKVRNQVKFTGAESPDEVTETLSHIRVVRCNVRKLQV